MKIEEKLERMGLVLPPPSRGPANVKLPFAAVRVRGNRAFIAGHGPQLPDGSIPQPRGKVGAEVSEEQGYAAACYVALSMLGSIKRELGDLDRVTAWLRVFGMVNVAPGFNNMPVVINGFSDFIIELFGPEIGIHSRSAVGLASLPWDIPVEIEAEIEISE